MSTGQYERVDPDWPRELSLDDQAGPAAHISRTKADAMIAAALFEAGFGAPVDMPAPVAAPVIAKKRGFRAHGLLWQAAAVLAMCFVGMGSASAAVMLWKRYVAPETVITAPAETPKPKKHKAKRVEVEKAVEVTEPAPKVILDELVIEQEREKRKEKRAPEDFLEEANRLRADKQWRAADENYARVWQAAPKSSAAYVARVASASVRLEHLRDPRTALSRYKAALEQSPRGPLLEEIRFGIAESYRAMGARSEEKKALQNFVHDLPGSGLAKKARARLAELEAAP